MDLYNEIKDFATRIDSGLQDITGMCLNSHTYIDGPENRDAALCAIPHQGEVMVVATYSETAQACAIQFHIQSTGLAFGVVAPKTGKPQVFGRGFMMGIHDAYNCLDIDVFKMTRAAKDSWNAAQNTLRRKGCDPCREWPLAVSN
jgi:hypothetical protein